MPVTLIDRIRIERGVMADYHGLSRFHYRSAHPGAVKRIWRAVLCGRSFESRLRAGRVRHVEPPDEVEVVGVLVEALPSPSCRLRDLAVGGRYRDLGQRDGAVMLNREVRCISRVIVDPRLRGTGLAVRLVRAALVCPEPGVRFTEALAAMGRVSPFFERAGMMRYQRPPRADEARLIDALRTLNLHERDLGDLEQARAAIERLPCPQRRWIEQELRRWRRASARLNAGALAALSLEQLLDAARHRLLLRPAYFIFAHDHAIDLATKQP